MHLRRRFLAVLSPVLLVAAGWATPAPAGASMTLPVPVGVVANADWILRCVLPDGAIVEFPGAAPTEVEPYFANYAAIGLARAAALTRDATYSQAAWNWLAWYVAHEGPNGFVTNYTVSAAGAETSTGSEDSTDAYAGTFLSAVGMAYAANPSPAVSLQSGIQGAIDAILATRTADGLTWATPWYHVKYFLDNSEAYNGLLAAEKVETALGQKVWASKAASAATAMVRALHNMWNTAAQDYNWAKFAGGGEQTADWTVLYPDALEEVGAAAYGTAAGHANVLMTTFARFQPAIADPAQVGYQPLAVLGLEALGATATPAALAQAAAIDAYAAATNYAWPFIVGVAGQQIMADSDTPLAGS